MIKKIIISIAILFIALPAYCMNRGLTKQDLLVPSKDSSSNGYITDVIGNKTDHIDGNSLYSKMVKIDENAHSASKVYPTLANGVTLTTAAGAWALGTITEIVPASTITSQFDIHWVDIGSVSAADTYELVLYYGAGDTECGRVRFTRPAGATTNSFAEVKTIIIPANSKISGAIASSGGGADTTVVSIGYHIY